MSPFNRLIGNIAQYLQAMHWYLATAESCTGGLIASCLTETIGSSNWFDRGFVTYSNLSKQELLGVDLKLINEFGAVSEDVAFAMAVGALEHSAANIALSVTGIAGPDGGTIEKPVGTVCLGWAAQGMPVKTIKVHLKGDRQEVRLAASERALEGVLQLLREISKIPH